MTEIFIGAAVGLSVAVLGAAAMKKSTKQEQARETAEAVRRCQEGGARILAVEALKRAEMSLRKQRGAGYGPWMSACLERAQKGLPVDPSVALTAVRWTLRELESAPVSYDKDGNEMYRREFDTTALEMAARELEGLTR